MALLPWLRRRERVMAISSPINATGGAAMKDNRRNEHWFQPAEQLQRNHFYMDTE
jgi:hypothetical protein